mmetsp:Transcript_85521/g.275918  ORF Transcript_85521/g.275918 Transcript_85521/m.275918 type:complete len:93 (+) Transcript_85521:114-392(+)
MVLSSTHTMLSDYTSNEGAAVLVVENQGQEEPPHLQRLCCSAQDKYGLTLTRAVPKPRRMTFQATRGVAIKRQATSKESTLAHHAAPLALHD